MQNCYNLQKVPPKYFKIFIPYIKSLQGRAKKLCSDEAIAMVESHDSVKLDDIEASLVNESENREELKKEIINSKVKRASKVVEILNQWYTKTH